MTKLSSAAQAVWSSYESILEYECVVTKTDMKALAAALRTLSDDWRINTESIDRVEYIRASTLKKIAAELEGQ